MRQTLGRFTTQGYPGFHVHDSPRSQYLWGCEMLVTIVFVLRCMILTYTSFRISRNVKDVSVLRKLKILSLKILSSFSPAMNSSIISNGFHDTLSPHQGILPSNTSLPTSVLSLDRMRYLGDSSPFKSQTISLKVICVEGTHLFCSLQKKIPCWILSKAACS